MKTVSITLPVPSDVVTVVKTTGRGIKAVAVVSGEGIVASAKFIGRSVMKGTRAARRASATGARWYAKHADVAEPKKENRRVAQDAVEA